MALPWFDFLPKLLLAAVEAPAQSAWFDFWPKFWLAVIDKAVLGIAVAVLGYWFQKRLELFKRDQSLASEVAKARLAAYHRVFAAIAALDYTANLLWDVLKRLKDAGPGTAEEEKLKKDTDEYVKEYEQKMDGLGELIAAERFLLGEDFTRAARQYRRELVDTAKTALAEGAKNEPPGASEYDRRKDQRRRLLEALVLCLPPYAREPVKDPHFVAPRMVSDDS